VFSGEPGEQGAHSGCGTRRPLGVLRAKRYATAVPKWNISHLEHSVVSLIRVANILANGALRLLGGTAGGGAVPQPDDCNAASFPTAPYVTAAAGRTHNQHQDMHGTIWERKRGRPTFKEVGTKNKHRMAKRQPSSR
jgi:hypothetical protein